jgi:hypothetical protein
LAFIEDLLAREAQEEGSSSGGGSAEREGKPLGFRDFLGTDPTVTEAQALVEQLLERQKARRSSRRREAELAKMIRKGGRRRGDPPSDLVL